MIDATDYSVNPNRLHITAQDPRAIAVDGNGLLYVASFESNNQSELSICPDSPTNPPQCTLGSTDLGNFVAVSPNIPGADTRIVIDPDVPDRDLFVFDTRDLAPGTGLPQPVDTLSGVGTLLYGLAVSGGGDVFITQTDARNTENGEDGENLPFLQNRMFLNQIGRASCTSGGCILLPRIELEPLPPSQPADGRQLATPYGVAVSGDGATVVATAMGTSRVFTLDAATGAVRGILDLHHGVAGQFGQQIPKGVALRSDVQGAPETAYVLNTLENTVSVIDVRDPDNLVSLAKIPVGSDPTPAAVRRGRIAMNNAFASSTGTFSCGSCHPDAHTDQLLWRIGGPCFFGQCTGDDEIRSTMPLRGLKNTLPLHWDGVLGDPFGGDNGAFGTGDAQDPTCTDEHDCFLHLVEASLAGVMCDQTAPEGCPQGGNELSIQEQDDLATFLASVSYPPPRSRPMDDSVSASALGGFSDFFVDRPGNPVLTGDLGDLVGVTTCADMNSGCHALPLGADHSSSTLAGFDAPTMRGMTDRFLQFSIGITNAEESHLFAAAGGSVAIPGLATVNFPPSEIPWDPDEGFQEDVTFASAFPIFDPVYGVGPIDMFQMFEEASTGFSGAIGRQVTLNNDTTNSDSLAETETIMTALEDADARGSLNLRAVGVRDNGSTVAAVTLSYRADRRYWSGDNAIVLTSAQLVTEAQNGTLNLTLTGALSENFGKAGFDQPLLSVRSTADKVTGDPNVPVLNPAIPVLPGDHPMQLVGIDVRQNAEILVDGRRVWGSISCNQGGKFEPYCSSQLITIALDSIPGSGLHLLQVQNPGGPMSVELPICAEPISSCL